MREIKLNTENILYIAKDEKTDELFFLEFNELSELDLYHSKYPFRHLLWCNKIIVGF